ncbi:MAG TPA: radical SAM protein [Methanoculleus sp.]|nr:radical SAM protein [Methanoculleus sp.]
MNWTHLKARLLSAGTVRLTGEPADRFVERSRAGPGAGGEGSVFFTPGDRRRVRLSLDPASDIELVHRGEGRAELRIRGEVVAGRFEAIGLHCPRQAYITVSEGCIFRCSYCPVPLQEARVKTPDEVAALVERVLPEIDAISLTSGVVGSVEEDERRVLEVVRRVASFGKPVGVSIYPLAETPRRLHALGVAEVKFNVETATEALFRRHCPGLDREALMDALRDSVDLFGRNHVFSNVILGLGETDEELEQCIEELCAAGVIPVVRPLTPSAGCAGFERPSAARIETICAVHARHLAQAGLDPAQALTMCPACTGCDLVPGRDA